ncbi:hypothetical protein E6H17_06815 [Candidatus Bathyarchaeota archaeon]|nr:MAG: hypothetical protein E6H17_06815 [Candidatus Bathyarchaeota archaeon]
MVDGGAFQAGLGPGLGDCSVGGRIVELGGFWGVGWKGEEVGLDASARKVCNTAEALFPATSCFWAGNVSVEDLAAVDHVRLGLALGLLGLELFGNGGTA